MYTEGKSCRKSVSVLKKDSVSPVESQCKSCRKPVSRPDQSKKHSFVHKTYYLKSPGLADCLDHPNDPMMGWQEREDRVFRSSADVRSCGRTVRRALLWPLPRALPSKSFQSLDSLVTAVRSLPTPAVVRD